MKSLLIEPSFGLCNRLLALVSGFQVSAITHRRLGMWWDPTHKACACEFRRLFSNNVDEVSPEEIQKAARLYDQTTRPKPPSNQIRILAQHEVVAVRSCSVFWLPGHRPDPRRYLPELKVASHLQERIDQEWQRFATSRERSIGLHLRATDHRIARRISTPEKFIRRAREALAGGEADRFLVCTDNPEVEEQLRNSLGDRMFAVPKTAYDRRRGEAIESALVDLKLLARTGKVWGSYGSTYSRVAAAWGRVPLKIVQ